MICKSVEQVCIVQQELHTVKSFHAPLERTQTTLEYLRLVSALIVLMDIFVMEVKNQLPLFVDLVTIVQPKHLIRRIFHALLEPTLMPLAY